jgi:hypothetical protein
VRTSLLARSELARLSHCAVAVIPYRWRQLFSGEELPYSGTPLNLHDAFGTLRLIGRVLVIARRCPSVLEVPRARRRGAQVLELKESSLGAEDCGHSTQVWSP